MDNIFGMVTVVMIVRLLKSSLELYGSLNGGSRLLPRAGSWWGRNTADLATRVSIAFTNLRSSHEQGILIWKLSNVVLFYFSIQQKPNQYSIQAARNFLWASFQSSTLFLKLSGLASPKISTPSRAGKLYRWLRSREHIFWKISSGTSKSGDIISIIT